MRRGSHTRRGRPARRRGLMRKQWALKRGTNINAYDMDRQIEADPLYRKEIAEIVEEHHKLLDQLSDEED